MRSLYNIMRWVVGLLFIFSGLVKANDPLGLAYKMQEFFEVWQTDLNPGGAFGAFYNWGHHQALPLSIFMITAEVVAGVALLTRWRPKPVLWFLLLLILFFTFLTAFAYTSGRFKNCGCFGDCIPLTPLLSLLKDLFLLGAVLFLLLMHRRIDIINVAAWKGWPAVLFSLFATLVFQWYALTYLPLKDCLPFRVGANIPEGMKPPKGAVQDSFDLRFVYQKDGKQFQFTPAQLPADIASYQFVDRKQVLVRKGNAEPAIKGFSLMGMSGADSTQPILQMHNALLVFVEKKTGLSPKDVAAINNAIKTAKSKNVFVAVAASDVAGVQELMNAQQLTSAPVFSVDNTAVRTAARANPTLVHLKNGTVVAKQSAARFNQVLQQIQ